MGAKREERAVAIPVAGEHELVLDGLFCAGTERHDAGTVIAPPHPLYGGSMDSPVVTEIAWSCRNAELASLRFNWRGVGASTGAPSGTQAAADADYDAALGYLAETVPGELVAAGYSFGAVAALRAAARAARVRRVLLIAPPPDLVDGPTLAALGARTLIVAGELDRLAPPEALVAVAERSPRVRCVTIPEADHFFGSGLAQLGTAVSRWLAGD